MTVSDRTFPFQLDKSTEVPSLRKLVQENWHEIESNLGYIVGSRSVCAVE